MCFLRPFIYLCNVHTNAYIIYISKFCVVLYYCKSSNNSIVHDQFHWTLTFYEIWVGKYIHIHKQNCLFQNNNQDKLARCEWVMISLFFQNSNILSAVLCLIKELDGPSLEVAEMAVRCRMEELEDWWGGYKRNRLTPSARIYY